MGARQQAAVERKHALALLNLPNIGGFLTPQSVQSAFRAKARLAHPDRGGDAEAFKALVAARDCLLKGTT